MNSSKYRNYIYGEEKYPQYMNKKIYVNAPLDSYHHIYNNKYNNTRHGVIHNRNIDYDNILMSNNGICFPNHYNMNVIKKNNIEYKNNLTSEKKRYNNRNKSYNNIREMYLYPSRIEKCRKDNLNHICRDKKKNRYTFHIGNNKNNFELGSNYKGIHNNHPRFAQKNMDENNKDTKCISIKTVINKPNVTKIPCINYDTKNYNIKLGWWNFGKPLKIFSNIEKYKQNIKEKYYENRKFCKNISSTNSLNKYSNKFLCNEYFYIPITNTNYFKNKSLLNKNCKSYPVSDFHKVNLRPITGFIQSYKKEKEKKKNLQQAIIKISKVPYVINDYKKKMYQHKHMENIKELNKKQMKFDMTKNIYDNPNLDNTCGFMATISSKYNEENNSKGVIITCQQNNIKKKKKYYMNHKKKDNTIKGNKHVNIKLNNNTFDKYKENGHTSHLIRDVITTYRKKKQKKKKKKKNKKKKKKKKKKKYHLGNNTFEKKKKSHLGYNTFEKKKKSHLGNNTFEKKNHKNTNLDNVKKYKIYSTYSEESGKYHITSESKISNESLDNIHKEEQLYHTYKKPNNKYMINEPIKRYRMKIKTHKKNQSNEENGKYNENRKSSYESSYYDKKYVMKCKEIKNNQKNKSYSISSLSSQVSLNQQTNKKIDHVKNIHHKIKPTNCHKYNKYHEYHKYNKHDNTLKTYSNINDLQKVKRHAEHNIESDHNSYTNSLYQSNYLNKEDVYDHKQNELHQKVPSRIYDDNYNIDDDSKYFSDDKILKDNHRYKFYCDENYSCQKNHKYDSNKLKGYGYNYKNVEKNSPNYNFYRNNKLKNNKIHESNLLEKEYDEYFHDKY
ncbi:hypothetical protein PFNF54_03441 [Plasmodium falciparum NF54]|uniref:Uncharacterized protein n=1 Tax=Plasmodium falciparum (isolate NF54) TaxID=5843 RepID=W7KDV4_PLAFO|nr:hypothetical protein PFNF54_03441 [Plasmodium falciparum NF54]